MLKQLDLLGNLSNRSNYSYTETDVQAIFKAIRKKVRETELRFRVSLASSEETDFNL